MKKKNRLYVILEKMASCMVGSIIALLTWDAAMLAIITDGRLQSVCCLAFVAGLCLTLYWILVPREVDRKITWRKKRAARRAGTR